VSPQNTFNDSQLRAIAHEDGPAIVVAGPGSGKTAVLVSRIRYLIKELHKNPSEIAVITFTKAAAEEMESRCRAIPGLESTTVTFGTFHSLFLAVIRMLKGKRLSAVPARTRSILADWEKRQIITDFLHVKAPEFMYDELIVSTYEDAVSRYRNTQKKSVPGSAPGADPPFFSDLIEWYELEKKKRGRIDFEDILSECEQLLTEDTRLLEDVQARFKYLMIDEFQDINAVQYRTICLIAGRYRNIFAVGDDDQAIYGFRGASPDFMIRFKEQFPDASSYFLDINYRSGAAIVEASQHLIKKNSSRIPKTIHTGRKEPGTIMYHVYRDPDAEAEQIVKAVRRLIQGGIPCGRIAVLGRTHLMVKPVLRRFQEHGIPCRSSRKAECRLNHFLIRDIEAYYRLTLDSMRRADFLLVMNRPFRNISPAAFPDETASWERLFQYYSANKEMTAIIREFYRNIQVLGRLPADTGITYIRNVIGYDEFLSRYAAKINGDLSEWREILDKAAADAERYPNVKDWLSNIDASRSEDGAEDKDKAEAVMVSTYHGVKGLEFHTVFLPSLNEGLVPDKKAVMMAEIEEERRLFYVAVTRAAECLHLSWTQERRGKQAAVSGFVEESVK